MVWPGHFTINILVVSLQLTLKRGLIHTPSLIKKLIFLNTLLVTVLISCSDNYRDSQNNNINSVSFDLDSIRKRGKLIAVTDYNSINYFIYNGDPMGFHYELLKSFSDHLGIDLEIITENNPDHAFVMLNSGEADILALGLTITSAVKNEILLREMNHWITTFKKTRSFALLYAKYFKNSRSGIIAKSDYYDLNAGKISRYDDIIREFSAIINWDWRLLASLICQESHFSPNVRSRAGAYGLMQIMPVTGRYFKIDIKSSPENNIKAGIQYINWLNSIFDLKISDENEKIYFILAAYNAGPGHVLDAMKLAEKNGMDPQRWDGSVAFWILKKSEPRYYKDIVVKHGYFRGRETVNFVSEILERFEHYKNIIPEEKSNLF